MQEKVDFCSTTSKREPLPLFKKPSVTRERGTQIRLALLFYSPASDHFHLLQPLSKQEKKKK